MKRERTAQSIPPNESDPNHPMMRRAKRTHLSTRPEEQDQEEQEEEDVYNPFDHPFEPPDELEPGPSNYHGHGHLHSHEHAHAHEGDESEVEQGLMVRLQDAHAAVGDQDHLAS